MAYSSEPNTQIDGDLQVEDLLVTGTLTVHGDIVGDVTDLDITGALEVAGATQLDGNVAIGNATTDLVGFYGATAVDQPAALTAALTALTHSAPGTPDFAIQQLVQNTGFGFVTEDEGETVLQVIVRTAARVAELEARLEELGLVAAN